MHPNNPKSKLSTFKQAASLFLGGAGAGLIVFALFGGIWHVAHFWWVMTAITISCGLLAVFFRQSFENILDAFADNAPWL